MAKQNKKIISVLLIVITAAASIIFSAGTSADPLLTLSYFENIYLPGVAEKTAARLDGRLSAQISAASSGARAKKDQAVSDIGKDKIADQLAQEVVNSLIISGKINTGGYRAVEFSQGGLVSGVEGTAFMPENGTIVLSSGSLVDIAAGSAVSAGTTLKAGTRYIFAEGGATLKINSPVASVSVSGACRFTPYTASFRDYADALKILGLFKGTNNGYELGREATRLEGLVMLIRLMGEEQEALSFAGSHPFKDVPVWTNDTANKYVAYAYHKGYTNGISKTQFGSAGYITGPQYVTMVLRALGYSDAAGDFVWDKSFDKAVSVGLYTQAGAAAAQSGFFRRDQVVEASCNALFANLKGTSTSLIDSLQAGKAFSAEARQEAVAIINKKR